MEPSTTNEPANPHGNHTFKHHSLHYEHQDHHHGTLSSTSILIITISAISVVVVLIVFLLLAMFRRFKSSKNGCSCKEFGSINTNRFNAHTAVSFTSSPDVQGGCLYGSNLGPIPPTKYKGVQVFTYRDLEVATNKFSEANVLGNAGFGVLYRGVLRDGTVAAIKMLHREGKQGERAFRIEVDLLSRLHSPYLVELLGYCADQHHRILIFEFMPNGTLYHHLHHKQYRPLDWGTRLRIALDCARALEFLHEHTVPAVIHRDFKCSNILLDQNFRAKVSEFGLAKMSPDRIKGQNSTRVLGTTGYLAPEYVSTGKLTTKSDVYSYGVVLLQLFTGRIPIDTKRPPGEHVLVSWALPRLTNREKVVEMVDPALEGRYSKKDLIQIAAIASVCVQPEPDYRPLMTDVVQSLIPLVKNPSSISAPGSSRFLNQPSPRSL